MKNKDGKKQVKNEKIKAKRIEITDIIIALIIIVIFGIALLSFFPGLLTSDVVDEISQAEVNQYYNAHPIFHSFVIGNLTKLGGIWVPALFQILVFAIIWTYACRMIRKYNNTKANKAFQVIFTFIMAIIPLNFLYSITLWKDWIYNVCNFINIKYSKCQKSEKCNYSCIFIYNNIYCNDNSTMAMGSKN